MLTEGEAAQLWLDEARHPRTQGHTIRIPTAINVLPTETRHSSQTKSPLHFVHTRHRLCSRDRRLVSFKPCLCEHCTSDLTIAQATASSSSWAIEKKCRRQTLVRLVKSLRWGTVSALFEKYWNKRFFKLKCCSLGAQLLHTTLFSVVPPTMLPIPMRIAWRV